MNSLHIVVNSRWTILPWTLVPTPLLCKYIFFTFCIHRYESVRRKSILDLESRIRIFRDTFRGGHRISTRGGRHFLGAKLFQKLGTNLKRKDQISRKKVQTSHSSRLRGGGLAVAPLAPPPPCERPWIHLEPDPCKQGKETGSSQIQRINYSATRRISKFRI